MELVDRLDSNGNRINDVIDKDIAHKEGIFHPVIHIVVINKDKNKILLQKRSANKKIYANMWDVAAAGHVDSNEDYLQAAKREFSEELGLKSEDYKFNELGYYKEIYDYKDFKVREYSLTYLIIEDIDINLIKVQKEEVIEIKWVSKEDFYSLIKDNKILIHEFYKDLDKIFM